VSLIRLKAPNERIPRGRAATPSLTHKQTAKPYDAYVKQHYKLEEVFTPEKFRTIGLNEIVETDDPWWIDSLRALFKLSVRCSA